MNFTKEQKLYIKRRLKELNKNKISKSGSPFLKVFFNMLHVLLCCLILGCSAKSVNVEPNIANVMSAEFKFLETKLGITAEYFRTAVGSTIAVGTVTTKSEDKSRNTFGCTPEKPKEPPMIIKPSPDQIVKPKVEKPKAKIKAIIYSVKKSGNTWVVKTNKFALKNVKVRIFIGYCYYEGIPDKDGITNIDIGWHPPNQSKVGVSVFQLTNTPEIGSGNTLASAVIPMP